MPAVAKPTKPCPAERHHLVTENLPIVQWAVNLAVKRYPALLDHFEREDLFGEALARAVVCARLFDPKRAKFGSLVVLAVRRALLQMLEMAQHPKRQPEGGKEVPFSVVEAGKHYGRECEFEITSCEGDQGSVDDRDSVAVLLGLLSCRERNVIEAHYLQGKDLTTIAKRQGVVRNVVFQIKERALAKMRRYLEGEA